MAEDDKAKYEQLRQELLSALPKKRAIDKQLAQLETQLYNLEGTYLTETGAHSGGNIIHGYENYLKQSITRRKYEVTESDRLFTNSSLTSQRALELTGEGEEGSSNEETKQPTPGVTTVIVPPATRNQELTVAQQNKLNRDRDYQRRKRAARREASDEEVIPTSTRRTKRARHTTADTDD